MNEKALEEWLIAKELHYRGENWKPQSVPRVITSPADPRRESGFPRHGMTGGDRMQSDGMGFAKMYARYLQKMIHNHLTIAEVGILQGTGLALWCDLPNIRRVCGFDIDIRHYIDNQAELVYRGAFTKKYPDLYRLDQYVINYGVLSNALKPGEVDVYIDDGTHDPKATVNSLNAFMPFLRDGALVFIEDIKNFSDTLQSNFSKIRLLESDNEYLTVGRVVL